MADSAVDYPFSDPNSSLFTLIYSCTFFVGFILSTGILYSVIKEGKKLLTKKLDQLIFLIVLFTWIRSGLVAIFTAQAVADGGYDKSFCNATGFVLGVTVYSELLGHVLLALERYCVVVRQSPLPDKAFFAIFWTGFAVILTICSIQLLPDFQYGPRNGAAICNFQFLTNNPKLEVTSLWAILNLIGGELIVMYCYLRTYFEVRKAVREASAVEDNPAYRAAEYAVFIRCISISVTFFVCYTLQQSVRLYEQITLTPVATLFAQIETELAYFDVVALSVVVVAFGKEHKEAFLRHVFLRRDDEPSNWATKA